MIRQDSVLTASVAKPTENAIQRVHDPCIIRAGDYYYLFTTGPGIPIRRSKDLRHWEDISKLISFPEGTRHGTVLQVSADLLKPLLAMDAKAGS